MKKFIVFICIISIAVSLSAQQNRQHFLWFTGHWSKTKKNTFITTASSDTTNGGNITIGGGATITATPDGGVTIASPDIDDWNKKIDDGENVLDKDIKALTNPSNEAQEWAYHLNKVTLSQLDTIKTQWENLKIDKNENPLNPEQQQTQALQNFANNLSSGCKKMQPGYQAIIGFYHEHRHDKESDYHNPPPPVFDFNCIACDTNLVKQHEKETSEYVENFFQPESDLIQEGLGILRSLILIGRANDINNTPVNVSMNASTTEKVNQAFYHNKSDPSKSGACAYIDSYELNQAIQFLSMRMYWRADKLFRDNRKNFKTVMPVLRTYLIAARETQLMGNKIDDQLPDLGVMVEEAYDYYFNKLTKDHDWSQLANIPFIISLARQNTLLTGAEVNTSDLVKIFNILNSFHLNIEMEIKIGKNGDYRIAHLKGKAKIAPEFAYSQDSCYEWVIVEDQPNNLGQPVKKADQKINIDLLDNEIVTQIRPVYTGTKKYWCSLQQLKMDYCHPGKDTILLTGFNPEPVMNGTWKYPKIPQPVNAGINSLDHYFQDFNKIKKLAESGDAKKQAEIAKEQGEKMLAQIKAMQSKMGTGHNGSQIGNYQDMMNMINKARQLSNNESIAPLTYIDFPLQIQNNTATLFNKRFDAKEINPRLAEAVVYGYYTVDIEYKPSK